MFEKKTNHTSQYDLWDNFWLVRIMISKSSVLIQPTPSSSKPSKTNTFNSLVSCFDDGGISIWLNIWWFFEAFFFCSGGGGGGEMQTYLGFQWLPFDEVTLISTPPCFRVWFSVLKQPSWQRFETSRYYVRSIETQMHPNSQKKLMIFSNWSLASSSNDMPVTGVLNYHCPIHLQVAVSVYSEPPNGGTHWTKSQVFSGSNYKLPYTCAFIITNHICMLWKIKC